MTIRAADDTVTIARRLVELAAESEARRNCTCRTSDDGGGLDAASVAGCPVHRMPPLLPLLAGLPPGHVPEDDWDEALRRARAWRDPA